MKKADARSVAVVGAGIIGVTAAFELACRGYEVSLFDSDKPGEAGPSKGNAGHIAAGDISPVSGPGIAWTGLKMLTHRNGALKIGVRHLPKLAPWLWQFRNAGKGKKFETATSAITRLGAGSVNATEQLFIKAGIGGLLKRTPALYVYESKKSYDASMESWELKQKAGREYTRLSSDEVLKLEPGLLRTVAGGVLAHDWAVVSDPLDVVKGIHSAATSKGVRFHRTSVTSLSCDAAGVVLSTCNGAHQFDMVVIAAGLASRGFAESLGEKLPLESEGGYNLTYGTPAVTVNHPIVFADRGITATRLESGLRIGGWAVFSGPNAAARPEYFDRLQKLSKTVFPSLYDRNPKSWMGRRPSLPDSVPVISKSTKDQRIFYVTGHGHYGLTWAARTAEHLADLVEGADDKCSDYSIRRWQPI